MNTWKTAVCATIALTLLPGRLDAAKALAGTTAELVLPAVTELPVAVAAELAAHKGKLAIGVTKLSDEAAAALAKHGGQLRLDRLKSLTSLPLAERFGQQAHVILDKVTRITPEIARAMCPQENRIHPIDDREVRRLTTLSHFTTDTYSRILAADALPSVAKFIYLDCDVAVCDDLAPLHATALAGRPLAAVVHRNATCHKDFAVNFGLTTGSLPAKPVTRTTEFAMLARRS